MKYLIALRACLGAVVQGMGVGVYSMVLLLAAAFVASPALIQPQEATVATSATWNVLWLWLIGCGISWLLLMRRDILREAYRAIRRKDGKRTNPIRSK